MSNSEENAKPVLIVTPEQEQILSRLPRAVLFVSHTGCEERLCHILEEAALADVLSVSLRAPIRHMMRGLFFGENLSGDLNDIPERNALEYALHGCVEKLLGKGAVVKLAIEQACDAPEISWPTIAFCDVGEEFERELLVGHFGTSNALVIHLLRPGAEHDPKLDRKYMFVSEEMTDAQMLQVFCLAVIR